MCVTGPAKSFAKRLFNKPLVWPQFFHVGSYRLQHTTIRFLLLENH